MAFQALLTLWLLWKTQHIHGPNCYTNTDKKICFPLNQNLTCAKYGIYVATCVIYHQQYVGQTLFSRDVQRTEVLGANQITGISDQMALPQHCSVFHDIINKTLWNVSRVVTL